MLVSSEIVFMLLLEVGDVVGAADSVIVKGYYSCSSGIRLPLMTLLLSSMGSVLFIIFAFFRGYWAENKTIM